MGKRAIQVPLSALIVLFISISLLLVAFTVVLKIQSSSIQTTKSKISYVRVLFDKLSKMQASIVIYDTHTKYLERLKSMLTEYQIPFSTTSDINVPAKILLITGGTLSLENSYICFTDIPPYYVYSYEQWDGYDYIHYLQQFPWPDLVRIVFDSYQDIKGTGNLEYSEVYSSVVRFKGTGTLSIKNIYVYIDKYPTLVVRYKKIRGKLFLKLHLQNIETSEVKEVLLSVAPEKGSQYYHVYTTDIKYSGWMYLVISLYPKYKKYTVTSIDIIGEDADYLIDYIAFVLNPMYKQYKNLYRLDFRDFAYKSFIVRCSLIIWYTADSDFIISGTGEFVSDLLKQSGIPVIVLDKNPFKYIFTNALVYQNGTWFTVGMSPELYTCGYISLRGSISYIKYLTNNTQPYILISSTTTIGDVSNTVPFGSQVDITFEYDNGRVIVNGVTFHPTNPLSPTPSTFMGEGTVTNAILRCNGEDLEVLRLSHHGLGTFYIPRKIVLYVPIAYVGTRKINTVYSPYYDSDLFLYGPHYTCIYSKQFETFSMQVKTVTKAKVVRSYVDPYDTYNNPYYSLEYDTSGLSDTELPSTFTIPPYVYIIDDTEPHGNLRYVIVYPSVNSIIHINGRKIVEAYPAGEEGYGVSTDLVEINGKFVRVALKVSDDPYRSSITIKPFDIILLYESGTNYVCLIGKEKNIYNVPIGGLHSIKDISDIMKYVADSQSIEEVLPTKISEEVLSNTNTIIINIYYPHALLSKDAIVHNVKFVDRGTINIGDTVLEVRNVIVEDLLLDECIVKYEDTDGSFCIAGKKDNIIYIPYFLGTNMEAFSYIVSKALMS